MTNGLESAFPEISDIPQFNNRTYGLTKREYFAAMAMQGIVSSNVHYGHFERMANDAVDLADALITALNKTTNE